MALAYICQYSYSSHRYLSSTSVCHDRLSHGTNQKIPDCLVKIAFLEKVKIVDKSGIKSSFVVTGQAQVTPFGARGLFLLYICQLEDQHKKKKPLASSSNRSCNNKLQCLSRLDCHLWNLWRERQVVSELDLSSCLA